MRSLSQSEGHGRATSDCWVGPEPSCARAMSTTPEHGAERMVSFHASELTNVEDEADEASGSIARSRLLFGKVSIESGVIHTLHGTCLAMLQSKTSSGWIFDEHPMRIFKVHLRTPNGSSAFLE